MCEHAPVASVRKRQRKRQMAASPGYTTAPRTPHTHTTVHTPVPEDTLADLHIGLCVWGGGGVRIPQLQRERDTVVVSAPLWLGH